MSFTFPLEKYVIVTVAFVQKYQLHNVIIEQ